MKNVEIPDELLDNLPELRKYIEKELRTQVFIAMLPDSIRMLMCSIISGCNGATLEEIQAELKENDIEVDDEIIKEALIEMRGQVEPLETPASILGLLGSMVNLPKKDT